MTALSRARERWNVWTDKTQRNSFEFMTRAMKGDPVSLSDVSIRVLKALTGINATDEFAILKIAEVPHAKPRALYAFMLLNGFNMDNVDAPGGSRSTPVPRNGSIEYV